MKFKYLETWEKVFFILWIGSIVIALIILILAISYFKETNINQELKTNKCSNQSINVSNVGEWNYCVITETCSNLTLFETAKCLNAGITEIYKFTERNENKYTGNDGSFEDIIINGGDCYDWNNLYVKLAKDLGFDGLTTTFYFNRIENESMKKAGHRFAVIYEKNNSEGYCILDGETKTSCVAFNYDVWKFNSTAR